MDRVLQKTLGHALGLEGNADFKLEPKKENTQELKSTQNNLFHPL